MYIIFSCHLHVHVFFLLPRPGDQACSWYYIVKGSVLISNNYVYGSGCSFGQCIDTNLRTDTCSVTKDPTELLKVQDTVHTM